MRSVFWRVFGSFWLAFFLVATSSMLLGRASNQDIWIIKRHPAIQQFAEVWTNIYETQGLQAANDYLVNHKKQYKIDIQILGDNNEVITDSLPPKPRPKNMVKHHRIMQGLPPPWRQIAQEYISPATSHNYLFIYRIPHVELAAWQRSSLWLPVAGLTITLIVLTIFSYLLTLYITKPLNHLREAVQALGRTAYQKNSLAKLASRKDEFGLLAADFSLMGMHLQSLIDSQRQLLRDVSHELRSPLARLKITLALLERSQEEQEQLKLLARLSLESDRLEALIAEILTLARLDSVPGNKVELELLPLLRKLVDDAKINASHQQITLQVDKDFVVYGWADRLERALDNILRNALRFNPEGQPIEIKAWRDSDNAYISIRDHGPGVSEEHLVQLIEPFYRVPGQTASGYGLGLSITKRAIESHHGQLILDNHPNGGLIVKVILPFAE